MFGRKARQIARLEIALNQAVADRDELLDSKVSGFDGWDRWVANMLAAPEKDEDLE